MVWVAELGSGCEGCGEAVALILGVTFSDRPTPALGVGMARHRRRVLLGAFGHREGGGRGVVPCTHGAPKPWEMCTRMVTGLRNTKLLGVSVSCFPLPGKKSSWPFRSFRTQLLPPSALSHSIAKSL